MRKFLFLALSIGIFLWACKSATDPKKTFREPTNIVWTKDVPAKHEIINGGAVTYNDEIYVLSGVGGRFMKYNPANYQWMDLSGLPGPRSEAAVTLWKDRFIVAGGIDDSTNFMRRVDYYDLKSKSWKSMNSLPEGRCRFSLHGIGDALYATGGNCGPNEKSYSGCLDVLMYADTTNQWKFITALKKGSFDHAAVNRGDDIFFIGGISDNSRQSTFFINNKSRTLGNKKPLPQARGNLGAIVYGDFILSFGGKTQTAQSPMEKFDIDQNVWTSLGNCPFWTDRFAYTLWKDRIYVFGGQVNPMQVWKGDLVFEQPAAADK